MNLHHLIHSSISEQLSDIKSHEDIKYNDPVIFHCYWNKEIGPNQLFSILSCYLTNVKDTNNKIILWQDFDIETQINNPLYLLLRRYCEVRYYDNSLERVGTALENFELKSEYLKIPSFYSDYVRLSLLSRYGGLWFDLDVIFFKSFDYLFSKYDNFVTTWGKSNHPNGVPFWSKNKDVIDSLILRLIDGGGGHLGFQDTFSSKEKNISFDIDIDLNILPCGWFDPMWICDTCDFDLWFKNNNNEYFYDDAYCYHWHNRNNLTIENGSPFHRNIVKIIEGLDLQSIIKEG